MKKLLWFSLSVSFIVGLFAQSDFFYSAKGEKENFKIRKDMVILKFEPETDIKSLVEPSFFISAYTFGDNFIIATIDTLAIDINGLKQKCTITDVAYALEYSDGAIQFPSYEILLKVKKGRTPEEVINYLNYTRNIERTELFDKYNDFYLLNLNVPLSDILQTCRDLYETGWCEIAEPSFIRTLKPCNTNPFFSYQWGLKNTRQPLNCYEYDEGDYSYDINIEPAWNITKGSSNIKVAVLDEGIQLDHPDLADNLILGYDATDGNYGGINGGYKEMDDHGTKCAGIIGALDNNIGTVGVAPNCKIVSVRIGYKPSTIKRAPPGNSLDEWITTDYWIEQNSIYTLSKNELEYLVNYAETHTGRGVVFANNILCRLYGICKEDAERQKSNTLNPDFQKAPLVAEEIKFPFNKLKGWTAKPDGVVKNGEAGRGSLSENIKIHPNPTTGELTIDNGQLTITGVEIFDVLGKKQFSIVNSQLSIETIDISHLHSGIYFVKITTDAGIVVKKIIKQ